MKTKRLIVANWKMNPESPEVARTIFLGIRRSAAKLKRTHTVVCPPAIYFGNISKFSTAKVSVGTQNIFWEGNGPHTGELSTSMVLAAGGTHAIIGHSERRAMGETSEMINKKVLAGLGGGLGVVLCIGEKERDTQGNYLSFIKEQLNLSLAGIQKKHVDKLVVAYEPVWAIGKSDKEAMRGIDMDEMRIYIKKVLSEMLSREYAESISVLYGGSVSSVNAEDIMNNGHIDGLLVGRQSLDPIQFKVIMTFVDAVSK